MRTALFSTAILSCLLVISCTKNEKTYGCPPLSYHYSPKFVIIDKATGEDLIGKEVYKKNEIRMFYQNGPGRYDTLHEYGKRDTIRVLIPVGTPIINGARDFYIKYNSVDIDTLKIQTKMGKKEACVTWYTPVQFYVNGKAAATPPDLFGTFVIHK